MKEENKVIQDNKRKHKHNRIRKKSHPRHALLSKIPYVLIRPMLIIAIRFIQLEEDIVAFSNFSKDKMLAVQRCKVVTQSEEKL